MSSSTTLHNIVSITLQQVTLNGSHKFYSTRVDFLDEAGHMHSISALSAHPIEIKVREQTVYETKMVAA